MEKGFVQLMAVHVRALLRLLSALFLCQACVCPSFFSCLFVPRAAGRTEEVGKKMTYPRSTFMFLHVIVHCVDNRQPHSRTCEAQYKIRK